MPPTLLNRYTVLLSAVLVSQAVFYYAVAARSEHVPSIAPLATFPAEVPGWQMGRDLPVDDEIQGILKADDLLSREYVNQAKRAAVTLFVAFFKTQRYNQSPHSPKNCLPGNGYDTIMDTRTSFSVPSWRVPIVANKFVVQHGDEKSVVLYWYQSHNRVIASEYSAKIWLVLDAIRYHRSDTSIVRVVVPVRENEYDAATDIGIDFIRAMFPSLLKALPA